MLEVFNRKIKHLLNGQEGFALALTLIVWPVVMLMITGVYVTGETIRRKMIMQAAADTAALAGAAVEADTLSRIAVINRMMAWTYVQANKMEMDYVVDEWLGRVKASMTSHGVTQATLNNYWNVTENNITTARSGFSSSSVKSKLDDAYANITAMNNALTELASDSAARSKASAKEILAANTLDLSDALFSSITCGALGSSLVAVSSEEQFLNCTSGGYSALSSCEGFGNWWVQKQSTGNGFKRGYTTNNGCLVATVSYYVNEGTTMHPVYTVHTDTVYGKDAYGNSVVARPRVPGDGYVQDGAVVVSVSYPLRNPLEVLFGTLTGSIYDAYTVDGTDMWCASAARACPWDSTTSSYSVSKGAGVNSTNWDGALISLAQASSTGKASTLLKSCFEQLRVSGWGESSAIDWDSLDGKAVH